MNLDPQVTVILVVVMVFWLGTIIGGRREARDWIICSEHGFLRQYGSKFYKISLELDADECEECKNERET